MLTNALSPYPVTITQKEKQLVLFKGNHYFYSPYRVIKQTTNVNVGTRNVESYSKLNPVTQTDVGFTYGPYPEQKPFAEVSFLLLLDPLPSYQSQVSHKNYSYIT